MKKKALLLFFSDDSCHAAIPVIPTVSALAKRVGIDFETYICTRPLSWGGKMLPFTGHMHNESFFYLANFYEKILFVSLTDLPGMQFRREILAWGGEVVSCRKSCHLLDFYKEVFAYFKQPVPAEAGVVPDAPKVTTELVAGEPFLTPYFYYDLNRRGCLGICRKDFLDHEAEYRALGIQSVATYCCDLENSALPVTEVVKGSDYGVVTSALAKQYATPPRGISFGDGNFMVRWTAYLLREDRMPLYEPFAWKEFIPTIAEYSKKCGNPMIVGCQNVHPHNTDAVMTEFAKHAMFFDLLGCDPRHGFSIQKQFKLPLDWLEEAVPPWEDEYSDEFLLQKIQENAQPVCFLFYAADLGHIPTLPRILDLMGQDGNRAGLAFPATWYDYHPELLEQLYVPLAQGGVFPQLEPMVSSGGVVVACEAEGMITPKKLTDLLVTARKKIAGHVGEKMVPPGYYPWQDASPFYVPNSGTPQYDAVAKAGFSYYISYKDCSSPGKILFDNGKLTAINQQIQQWFPGEGEATSVLKDFEEGRRFETDWIILGFDMPFFGLSPVYLNGEALHKRFDGKVMGMQTIAKAMKYVRNGGDSKRLFMLKPHELIRYIRLKNKHAVNP